jgi:A/G-specific adenine glycosylase
VWRKKINPYKILVSEVMLQQTQVSRVIPKFIVWMKRYPSLVSLRKASLKDVLTLWQGLGYQRRAKSLVAISKQVTTLPASYEELLKLPGVGPYTASAICAFAYDTFAHPVLETNIRTVLIEYFHQGEEHIHDGVLYDDLDRLQRHQTVIKMGARHFYYALMDYGAYLKTKRISHNKKSAHHVNQTQYKGSSRELRAKILFAIVHTKPLPVDSRVESILKELENEKFIIKKKNTYYIC